ncbi:MAG TPA: hemerythrin domain-containing protein [Polyangiaceae bacterium]|nr:hemerythrin domain-containing protein [Polyangiaceae bacterium]
MDAIRLLTDQHRQMEASLERLLKATEPERAKLFADAADLLMSHVLIEEQHFYPAVKAKRTEDILLESLEEHLSLKRLLADLTALDVHNPHFEPKVHVLKEQAEHHHKEEEENLFPKVSKALSSKDLDELGSRMQQAQADLLKRQPRQWAASQTRSAPDLT